MAIARQNRLADVLLVWHKCIMIQGECEKCEDRGEVHGLNCIVRKIIFNRDFNGRSGHRVSRGAAMNAAVQAIESYIQKQKRRERKKMSQLPSVQKSTSVTLAEKFGFTESQLDLIRRTVAKGATDDELEVFFYRAKMLNANPLMPGQIYFVKFGNSPGTIITGIDTFRNHAHATGKLAGVKRGVIRDKDGKCIGGWCDVYRTDWKEPAHEEVPMSEYNTGRNNWVKMPETMIKKVAEVAAYRMAFPNQLGGLYVHEEMEKVTKNVESETVVEPKGISEAQLKRMFAIAKSKGINSKEELKEWITKTFELSEDFSLTQLSRQEYDDVCNGLQNIAEKKIEESQPGDFNGPVESSEKIPYVALDNPVEPEKKPELPWTKYLDQDPRMVK